MRSTYYIGYTSSITFDLTAIVAARLGENYQLHERHLNHTLVAAQRVIGFDKVYARAAGAYLYDMDDTPYLDFLSGFSVFICDEIQTGLGGTGKMFGLEQLDLEPDIITLAKSLSGGYVPCGAIVTRREIYQETYSRMDRCVVHSTTFGRNNLAMACGLAALDVIDDEKLVENSARMGALLMRRIDSLRGKHSFIGAGGDRSDIGAVELPAQGVYGTISYCSNPVPGPVPNVTLTVTGDATTSAMTDGSGNYQFLSLAAGGNYAVTPSKAARAPGSVGINTVDVIATQRHFLNLGTPLSGCRLMAADVNGVGGVNTVDVIAIQRFYLSLLTGIANTGKYKFTPVNRAYVGLVSNQVAQNYDTLVFGDVASTFVERVDSPSQTAPDDGTTGEVPGTVAAIALPKVTVDASVLNFIVQVTATAIDAKNKLVGFQGDFTYDERVVTFQSEPVQKAGLTAGNWNVSGNVLPGAGPIRTLRISAYSNNLRPLSGSGTLFELRMTSVSKAAQGTPLLWAAPPDQFTFIDADLKTQKPGNAVAGSVKALKRWSVKPRGGHAPLRG